MESSSHQFIIPVQGKQFNNKEDIQQYLQNLEHDHKQVNIIQLSGNSHGVDACEYISSILKQCDHLKIVNLSDIFTSRIKKELPESLRFLALGLQSKNIIELDLSDNAFGPSGVQGFDFMLKEMKSLKVFRVSNDGLGPEGGSILAEAMDELHLEEFTAGRNRLENKGITALAKVFGKMESLKILKVPQNGIKKEGMIELLTALKLNKNLKTLWINDNWLKEEAVTVFCELLENLKELKEIDISDCDIGTDNSHKIFNSLKISPSFIHDLNFNHNEIEEKKIANECLDIALELHELKKLSIQGLPSNKIGDSYKKKFKDAERELVYLSDEDEDGDDDDEEDSNIKEVQKGLDNLEIK